MAQTLMNSVSSSADSGTGAMTSTIAPPSAFDSHTGALKKLSLFDLINLTVGIIGIQFAWSMQIGLSSRVLEPLGADPFLYGLIWCAGPITGLVVQPIIGALSDRTWTRIGRRRPYILVGAILGSLALLAFPFAPTLLLAALLIWVIDACVNISQGPYRALIPDNVPAEQNTVANSFLNMGFGAGSVIALGVAPLLQLFNIPMSIEQQYIMASLALTLTICYTSLMIREVRRKQNPPAEEGTQATEEKHSFLEGFRVFLKCDREIHKVCWAQFFTWIGMMCMFIYLTPFVVHSIYKLPDMSSASYKASEAVYNDLNQLSKQVKGSYLETEQAYQAVQFILPVLSAEGLQKINAGQTKVISESLDASLRPLLGVSEATYQRITQPAIKRLSKNMANLEASYGANPQVLNGVTQQQLQTIASFVQTPGLKEKLLSNTQLLSTASQNKLPALTEAQRELTLKSLILASGWINTLPVEEQTEAISKLPGSIQGWLTKARQFALLKQLDKEATNTAQTALVAFNLSALLLSVPLGMLANRFGKKLVHGAALACMVAAFVLAPMAQNPTQLIALLGLAGIAWATILSIPFAFLGDYMPKGKEGVIMGIFNMFVAGPQLISATLVSWLITLMPITTIFGVTHNWALAFQIAAACVAVSIIGFALVKEKPSSTTLEA